MDRAIYIASFDENSRSIDAFTYSKEIAKIFEKQRNVPMMKIGKKKRKKVNLDIDEQSELMLLYDIAITSDEYDYFSSAWDQYLIDSSMDLEDFLSDLMLYKFTEEEKEKIKPLIEVLTRYRHQLSHGIIDECEEIDEFYNMRNALLYFVRNVLGADF